VELAAFTIASTCSLVMSASSARKIVVIAWKAYRRLRRSAKPLIPSCTGALMVPNSSIAWRGPGGASKVKRRRADGINPVA
jgi:hypothetical protein